MAEELNLAGVILRRADLPAEFERMCAGNPRRAPHVAANPHLKPESWQLVLDAHPRSNVAADLCGRHLDADQLNSFVDAREVRFRPLKALRAANNLTEEQVRQLSACKMPSGSALRLADTPGLDTEVIDALAAAMTPRAALLFCAEHPKGRQMSAPAALAALLRRYDTKGAHGWVSRSLQAQLTWHFPAVATAALEMAAAGDLPAHTAAGVAAAVAAHTRDDAIRDRIRDVIRLTAKHDGPAGILTEAVANLIETGRLAGMSVLDDWMLAGELNLSASVDKRLNKVHGWNRPKRPGPPAELSLAIPSGAFALAHAIRNPRLDAAMARELARLATTVLFAEAVGLPLTASLLARLSTITGETYTLSERAKVRRAHKAPPVTPDIDGDVTEAPIDAVRAAVLLDPTSPAADALAEAVTAALGDDAGAWEVFLGIVDETGTTVGDAIEAANLLASIGAR